MNYINQNYIESELFQHSNSFKCSSYIDACKQYEFNQSMNGGGRVKSTKTSSRIVTNVKKMRVAITKKLKKLININGAAPHTPVNAAHANMKLNQTATIRRSAFKSRTSLVLTRSASAKRVKDESNGINVQLTNYKYNGSSNYDLTMVPNTPCALPRRLRYRRYSDGQWSSSSSSSSLASHHSSSNTNNLFNDNTNFRSAEITHLFASCTSQCQPIKSNCMSVNQTNSNVVTSTFLTSNAMQTSTPVLNKVRAACAVKSINLQEHIDAYTRGCEEPSLSQSQYFSMEKSSSMTRLPMTATMMSVDGVSCRNSSDDLIILQTKPMGISSTASSTSSQQSEIAPPPPPVPSQTSIIESHELVKKAIQQTMSESKNWNLLVINKYHNDTNATFSNLPEWAVGNQLNLAVVNQLYYNPNGNGVFNKPKI
jgi:hypothetical protein